MKKQLVRHLVGSLGVIVLIGLDQFSKYLAQHFLKGGTSIQLWPNVLELTYVENRGAAFGILLNQQWLFNIITAIVMIGLIYIFFRLPFEKRFRITRFCCALLLAGAAGNWIDRLKAGYVVDMIYFRLINFPVFNFADCLVVVGSILFCLAACLQKHLLDDIFMQLGKRKTHDAGTD